MSLVTTLLFLLVSARVLGDLTKRIGQPAIIGEIVAGIVLGPGGFGFVKLGPALSGISDLGVFLIIMVSGLEMNFREIISALSGKGLLIALLGFGVPLASGIGFGLVFSQDPMRTLFLGLSLSITALPVAIRLIESLKLQESAVAKYTIGAAIFSDVAALLALGIVLQLPEELGFTSIAMSLASTSIKLFAFAATVILLNKVFTAAARDGHSFHRFRTQMLDKAGPETLFGIVTLFVLAFSSISESLGLHFVIGAFFGSLLLSHQLFGRERFARVQETANAVSSGFLAPLFFASLGLQFRFDTLKSPLFAVSLIAVAMLSKIFAGAIGGYFAKLPRRDYLILGSLLNGRGVMGIVVADIAYQHHFIGDSLFSTLVLLCIVTTAATPLLVRSISSWNSTYMNHKNIF